MSKKNGKGPDETTEVVDAYKDEQMSSGVVVRVLPFPAKLHENISTKAMEKFPEPVAPKKIVKVVDGTEEVSDEEDPKYLAEKEKVRRERDSWTAGKIGEKVISFCLLVDVKPYEHILKELEESLEDPRPEDPKKLQEYFLMNYALRGRADYERATTVSLTLMAMGDKEITARMESFRSEMARAGLSEPETPGADESVGLEVEK